VSRQSVYQAEKRFEFRAIQLQVVKELVLAVRARMPRLGTRKLYSLLCDAISAKGIKLGRDALFALLRKEHMLIRRKRNYTKTTNSKHWLKKHPNLFKDTRPSSPEQVFVSDITYLSTREQTYYLTLVTDAYSRKIMGHSLNRDLGAEGVSKALEKAARNRLTTKEAIHHSDRGLQYASTIYQDKLSKAGMLCSMTDGYDCYQNALAERVNGILKQEFLFVPCKSYDELKAVVDESIGIYNTERPHLSLNMKTPEYVHKMGCEVALTAQT
jgi:transposase InsO family protein